MEMMDYSLRVKYHDPRQGYKTIKKVRVNPKQRATSTMLVPLSKKCSSCNVYDSNSNNNSDNSMDSMDKLYA